MKGLKERTVDNGVGGGLQATEVGTEERPDMVATRGHCCPIHGPGGRRDSRGFLETQWASVPPLPHFNSQTLP